MHKQSIQALLASVAFLSLAGCDPSDDTAKAKHDMANMGQPSFERMMAQNFQKENQQIVRQGLLALSEGEFQRANRFFNAALVDEPGNAFLHYVNGLTYHLMAREGDPSLFDLAEAGLQQSIKFNPSNHLAHLQMARVKSDKKEYKEAQEYYAGTLLLKPDEADALYEMASASYYLGDMKNAQMAIDRALKSLPNRPDVRKAAAMIYAAAGKHDVAQAHMNQYKKLSDNPARVNHAHNRVNDWRSLYQKGLVMAQAANKDQQDDSAAPEFDKEEENAAATPPQAAPGKEKAKDDGMGKVVVIDAVTLRVSDVGTTQKGSNILENLSLVIQPGSYAHARTLGQGHGTAITASNNFIKDTSGTGEPTGITNSVQAAINSSGSTRVFAHAIGFNQLSYGLNIFNSTREHVEVVGRPSLTTSVGSPNAAKFFSGTHLTLGLSPVNGGAGSIQEIPVGVTLEVHALSMTDDELMLDVKMYGSIISESELLASNGRDRSNPTQQFTRIGISKLKTRVKLRLGETLMLAGITERIDNNTKKGVPGLQDVPLIQYLFSSEGTFSERKSVVYLLTPRSYEANKHAIQTAHLKSTGENMKELQVRNIDWYNPDYNMAVTFRHLMPLYREYRHGDMDPLQWSMKHNYETQVAQAAAFLYF